MDSAYQLFPSITIIHASLAQNHHFRTLVLEALRVALEFAFLASMILLRSPMSPAAWFVVDIA